MTGMYVRPNEEIELSLNVSKIKAMPGFSFERTASKERTSGCDSHLLMRQQFDQALVAAIFAILKEAGIQKKVICPLQKSFSGKDATYEVLIGTYFSLYSVLTKGPYAGYLRLDEWLISNRNFYSTLRSHIINHICIDVLRKNRNEEKHRSSDNGDAYVELPDKTDVFTEVEKSMDKSATLRAYALLDEIHETLNKPLQLLIALRILGGRYGAKSLGTEILSTTYSMAELLKFEYKYLELILGMDLSRYYKPYYKNNALTRLKKTNSIKAVMHRLNQQSSLARLAIKRGELVSMYEKACVKGKNFTV